MHKVTAGDGYTYLTRHVAGGDVPRDRGQEIADYYTARGNPPGRWIGSAAHLLGLNGTVSEAQMKALFGNGQHPDADAMIRRYLAEHLKPGLSEAQRTKVLDTARKHASLGAAFSVYKTLENYQQRVAERLERISEQTGRPATAHDEARVRREEAGTSRAGVAGYDLVFTPVKSASILWGLHPDATVRREIGEAHAAAVASAMRLIEDHAAFTRTGKAGIAQVDTHGLIAASFDHFDNRNGDPNLHTHVVIANKVRVDDGRDAQLGERWRTLDARALYRLTVAASEHYSTSFQQQMTRRLGVAFEQRGDTNGLRSPVMEVAGVPTEAIWLFSSRRAQLTARLAELLTDYRNEHGHSAPESVRYALARQANLETRDKKPDARSLAEMQTVWRGQFTGAFGVEGIGRLAAAVPGTPPSRGADTGEVDVDGLAARVVAEVAEYRSTWTRWNLHAHAERVLRSHPGLALDTDQHHALVARIVDAATSPAHSIHIEAPATVDVPEMLHRADGTSVFTEHAAGRYTSRVILDAEQRLVAAATTTTPHDLDPVSVTGVLDGFEAESGARLDPGQRHLAAVFATDERFLVAGIGPAGAGKTTAMKAYAHVMKAAGRRVIPLAPSATAAGVLSNELGVAADSLHKLLYEHREGAHAEQLATGKDVPASKQRFVVREGDVILVDEAGMAGTLNLDRLAQIAAAHGASIRLLGDHRQLGAVESGGTISLIASEAGAVELDTIHRFNNEAEAAASLRIRVGDTTGLDFHAANGRICGGEHEAMIDAVYNAWHRDMKAGRTTMMLAPSTTDVTALSARARADRIEAGIVEEDGLNLRDGNEASVGDWIITRSNDRRLSLNGGKDFVRNGGIWKVLNTKPDGRMHVEHLLHKGRITLPAAYVRQHVELAYAATVTRAQGTTVDTIHTLITPSMTRENLYVAATRGRDGAWLYAVTHQSPDHDNTLDAARKDPGARTAREVLDQVLARTGNEQSATQTIRDAQDDAASLATLVPRYLHALSEATADAQRNLVHQILTPEAAEAVTADEAFSALSAALNKGAAAGWQPKRLLAHAARLATLHGTEHPAALLAHHAGRLIRDLTPPAPLAQPTEAETARYARLIRGHGTRLTLDPNTALEAPATLSATTQGDRQASYTHISKDRLAQTTNAVAAHLGLTPAQVSAHRAWPHLAAALTTGDGTQVPDLPSAYRSTGDLTGLARVVRAHTNKNQPPIPSALRHQHHTTIALATDYADIVRGSRYWPALAAALTTAENAGNDPIQVLQRAAANHQPQHVHDPALDLAEGVHRQVHLHHTGVTADPNETWREIAWMLKAHTAQGGNPAEVTYRVRTQKDLTGLRDHIAAHTTRPATSTRLPWIPATSPAAASEHWRDHIAQTEAAIGDRIEHLMTLTLAAQPAWATALGTQPETPAAAATWRQCLAVAAAYRDQYRVTSDDPKHPLGAYPEAGRSGHGAYVHAATALIHAHTLSTGEHPTDHDPGAPTGLGNRINDRIRQHLAATIYNALPREEQARIAATLQERAPLAAQLAPAHELAAHALVGGHVLHVLHENGHPTAPTRTVPVQTPRPQQAEQRPRQSRPRRLPASQPTTPARTAPPVRPATVPYEEQQMHTSPQPQRGPRLGP